MRIFLLGAVALCAAAPLAGAQKMTTHDDDAADAKFLQDLTATKNWRLGRPIRPRLTPDGSQVLFLRSEPRKSQLRLFALEVATGKVREVVTPDQVLGGAAETLSPEEKQRRERLRQSDTGFTSYELSDDGKEVLLPLAGRAYVVSLADGKAREVAQGSFDERLSPDGTKVAFVKDGELWVTSLGGKPHAITHGATADLVHAQAEFVAQEEMDRFTGWWWAPDSKHLVYETYDASRVEKVTLSDPVDPTSPGAPIAYPRPGKANVTASLGIIAAAGGKTTWITWDKERYPYLARVRWQEHAPLTILVQTRDQKDASLLAVDPKTGHTRELVHAHDDAWLNLDPYALLNDRNEIESDIDDAWVWLPDGSGLLWSSEASGVWQLELRDATGKLVRTLTDAKLGYRGIRHVTADGKTVMVAAGTDPFEQHVFAIPIAGGPAVQVTKSPEADDARFAAASPAHVVSIFGVSTPYRLEVAGADGKVLATLPAVTEKPPFVPRVARVRAGDFQLTVVKPQSFDKTKKYPVIVDVYGGPGTLNASSGQWRYYLTQWIADHGFIVVKIDNRGTPLRGHDWERAIRDRFADVPLTDQVAALQALGKQDPSLDLARVGVYGHSFGGYMAALAVLRRPDVFKAAVAAALVSEWLDYDTHYTERYLGVPAGDTAVYEANSLLKYAPSLSRPLLMVHGTADDNVHFSHSLKLADALFKAGRPYELLTLAGQTHGFYDPLLQWRYYQKLFAFFRSHL